MGKKTDPSKSDSAAATGLGRRAKALTLTVFAIVVLVVVGVPFYRTYVAPWYEPVLEVGDKALNRRFFVKKLRLYTGGDRKDIFAASMRALQDLQNIELIRQEALKRKIGVTEGEIDREIERRVKESSTGSGRFEDLYEAMLRGLRLTAQDFREMVEADFYRARLLADFHRHVPERAEQIHVYGIAIGSAEKGEELMEKLRGGTPFADLAEDESLDLAAAKKGGDMGWFPKGVDELTATGLVKADGILLKTKEEAQNIREKILAGSDFNEMARQNSLDDETRPGGGHLGWASTDMQGGKQYAAMSYNLEPGGIGEPIETAEGIWIIKLLDKSAQGKVIDDILFALSPGQVAGPLLTDRGYYVMRVAARDPDRPLQDDHRRTLARKKMDEWLSETTLKGSKEGWIKWYWSSDALDWVSRHLD